MQLQTEADSKQNKIYFNSIRTAWKVGTIFRKDFTYILRNTEIKYNILGARGQVALQQTVAVHNKLPILWNLCTELMPTLPEAVTNLKSYFQQSSSY